MSLPNAEDKELKTDGGGQKTEDREQADGSVCAPFSVIRFLRSVLRRPTSVLWLSVAASVCLVAVLIFLRGCERRPALQPTPQMGMESRFWVRVLLLNDGAECAIEVPSAFRLTTQGASGGMAMRPLESPTRISLVTGRLMLGTAPLGAGEVVLSPDSPHVFGLDGQRYRGRLRLIVAPDGQSFDAVNLVPMEPYLAGVVGREMPNRWEPQALRAQAIAARTYCLYNKNRFGSGRSYDVVRTQASQVYGGIDAESLQVWDAVNGTCGQVLIWPELAVNRGDSVSNGPGLQAQAEIESPPFPGLFPAYYSSTCGGHTSSSEEVFGDSVGPRQGVACSYCKDVAAPANLSWPIVPFDRATVTEQLLKKYPRLASLGEITDMAALEQSRYGSFSRLRTIRLTGSTGRTDTLRAEDLRLALDPSGRRIKSTLCRIIAWGDGWAFASGRGWGHGVGMCQCGAQGMARLGNDAESILQHYYPGAALVNVY